MRILCRPWPVDHTCLFVVGILPRYGGLLHVRVRSRPSRVAAAAAVRGGESSDVRILHVRTNKSAVCLQLVVVVGFDSFSPTCQPCVLSWGYV